MMPRLLTKKLGLFSLLFLFFGLLQSVQAQVESDTTVTYKIQTRDGNEYIGQILHQDEEFILFKTQTLGEITIAKKNVVSIQRISEGQIVGGVLWAENPQSTRYFWMPNGYNLKQGEGYYQNVWIFFNQGSIGITDNISIGVGTVPLFLFAATSSPFWLTPKVSIPIVENKFNIGAGALLGSVIGERNAGFGLVYGVATVGSRNKNASLGMGWGYAGGMWASTPVVSIGGMLRISKNAYLLSENYIIPIDNSRTFALIMLGSRIMVRKVGLDFGLVTPRVSDENDGYFALPWLGLTVPFYIKRPQSY